MDYLSQQSEAPTSESHGSPGGISLPPGRNPDTMIFHRVHKAIEEVSPIFDPAIKHFILADTDEQERTRTVVFAVFTSRFEFFGACHWTPITQVWDILDWCGGEKGRLSTTTTCGYDITRFRFIRVICLL